MRVSELVGTQLEDLDLQPQPTITVHGKGRRERRLPLWRETVTALKRWLRVRPNGSSRHLFLNDRGSALTRSGFAYLLDKYADIATRTVPSLRKKRVSPHVLRHTCAMLTLQATRDVRKVASGSDMPTLRRRRSISVRIPPSSSTLSRRSLRLVFGRAALRTQTG
jgi:site-specific recombinase XerD